MLRCYSYSVNYAGGLSNWLVLLWLLRMTLTSTPVSTLLPLFLNKNRPHPNIFLSTNVSTVCTWNILYLIGVTLGMCIVQGPRKCPFEFAMIWKRDTININTTLINRQQRLAFGGGVSNMAQIISMIWGFLFDHIGTFTDNHGNNIHRITSSSAICLQSKSIMFNLLLYSSVNHSNLYMNHTRIPL